MKIPKTLGLSEECWEEIEARRGALNRSAFVEVCLIELFEAQDELRRREQYLEPEAGKPVATKDLGKCDPRLAWERGGLQ